MHEAFVTTTRGLRRNTLPMRLFEKAKRLGIWNPADIDFSQDAAHWTQLAAEERDMVLRLTSLFQAGEEAVTLDLLPLLLTVAREGRLEEEMYLTTFLWEEAKHVDFFRRFLDEVAGGEVDLARYHGDNYRYLFYQALPDALNALLADPSPAAQARASVTYNMVAEGILAETGYYAYLAALERNGLLPGQCRGIALVKQDESRHIAYGVFLLSRLIAIDGGLWDVVESTMNDLLPYALGVIGDAFAAYEVVPFGLSPEDFTGYALEQFQRRMDRIEKARGARLEDILAGAGRASEEG